MFTLPFQPSFSQGSLSQPHGNVRVDIHFAAEAERKPVPFELVRDHLLFRARVQGREVWALLDNGSSVSAIDTDFARSRGLEPGQPAGRARTLSNNLEIAPVTGVAVEIPGQINMQAVLYAMDLSAPSKILGRPVSLIIGRDYFDILSFLIVPSNRTFQLGPSGTLNVPEGTPYLVLKDGKPQIDISILGKSASVMVDLGYNGTFQLGEQAWRRLGLDALPTFEATTAGADGRPTAVKSAVVDRVSIGPVDANQVTVSAGPVPPDSDGLIGMGFFARQNFAIDIKARRIYLFGLADVHAGNIQSDAENAALLFKLGRTDEAEKRFVDLHARAKSADDFNHLCWAKATAGIMTELAVAECRQAVALGDRAAQYLDSLGLALLQAGKHDEALAAYGEAIEKAGLAYSFMGRAVVHARKGNTSQAQADLAEARQRDPGIEDAFALYNLTMDTSPPRPPA